MTRSSGCRSNSRRVATPKLPPPPRSPHRSSPLSFPPARTTSPFGVTTLTATRLSQVRPYCAVRWPMPPPSVSPATPVEPTMPPGVTKPNAWVAESKSSQVAPPWALALRPSSFTSTRRMSDRSITSPPSHTQCPAGLCPPPRTATSIECARAKSKAVATSAGPRHRAIHAGLRSTRALNPRRATSYPESAGPITAPAREPRNSARLASPGVVMALSSFMEAYFLLGLLLAHRLVGQDEHAVRPHRGGVGKPQPGFGNAIPEQPLSAAEHDRKHHQPVLVDQVVPCESLDELSASGDQDVAADVLLQLQDLAGDVVADHGRVVPVGLVVAERGRDDVLRHGVHPFREPGLVGHRRPGPCEALISHPAEQLRVGGHQLVQLELVPVIAPVELAGPSGVLELLAAPGS